MESTDSAEPPRMAPIELKARRLALGMNQQQLARLLHVRQATVSMWERGGHSIPHRLDSELALLEDAAADLADRMVELLDAAPDIDALLVHDDERDFWKAQPEHEGLPVICQQVAAARAATEMRDDGRKIWILPTD